MEHEEAIRAASSLYAELLKREGSVSEDNIKELHEKFIMYPEAEEIITRLCEDMDAKFVNVNGSYYILAQPGSKFAVSKSGMFGAASYNTSDPSKKYFTDIKAVITMTLLNMFAGDSDLSGYSTFATVDTLIEESDKVFAKLAEIGEGIGYPAAVKMSERWKMLPYQQPEGKKAGTPASKEGFAHNVWENGRENGYLEKDLDETGKIRPTKRCIDLMPLVFSAARENEINEIITQARKEPARDADKEDEKKGEL